MGTLKNMMEKSISLTQVLTNESKDVLKRLKNYKRKQKILLDQQIITRMIRMKNI